MTIQEMVKKWQHVLDSAKHIPTWTEPHCLAYLCEAASRSMLICESGTYMGASAYVMLAANPACHLWCIDKFEVFGTQQVASQYLAPFIKSGRCELIVGDSARGAEMLEPQRGKIDMVWVDDGHAIEDLLRDIRCLLPLIRPAGLLCGHDFDEPYNDVARGVINSGITYSIPVPRLWSHTKSPVISQC